MTKPSIHPLQKYTLDILCRQKIARFSELRKNGADTNLFAYHLKLLTKNNMVKKVEGGYTLDEKGLAYAEKSSAQPKIITMLVIQNSDGDILLMQRNKQPYIDTWTLPYGKVHVDDATTQTSATRVAREKLHTDITPEHAGECYIRVAGKTGAISSTLVHVFRHYSDEIEQTERMKWMRPHKLAQLDMAPAVPEIMARTFFKDPNFFEEFDVAW